MARNLEIARLAVRLEGDVKGLEADLLRTEKSLGRLTDFIVKNPVAALAGLGSVAAVAAGKLVSMAADFEQSMAEIGTLVDTTAVDMGALAEGVLGLFRSLPVERLEDLTQGLYNVISAGVPAGDAIAYLRIAAEAAVGGVTDVNTAVDGLTTATNAFKEQGVTATQAADAFFVAVKTGKTTFGELAGSIGNVAGLANSLGISLDDLLANTSALTLGGLKTSQAMDALKQVLSNVAKPTAELRKEYPGLAKEFDLTALKSKGLTQFMLDLAARLGNNSAAAVKMFGSMEALNAVLSLTANDGAAVRDITAQMADKAGAAAEAFGKMQGTTKNTFQVLKNELGATMIELGEKILPAANAALGITLSLLQGINAIVDAFKGKEVKIADTIGASEIKNLREVLTSPLFDGRAIDLSGLKAGTTEFRVLTSAILTMRDVVDRDLTGALNVGRDALVQMRGTVEAYAKAHVRSMGEADAGSERTAQTYLNMLKFIDAQIATRAKPNPPPGTRTEDVEAAKKSAKALESIAKLARESSLALLNAEHREYLAAVEEFQEAQKVLVGADRAKAEEFLKTHLSNLLLKWAGFTADMDRTVIPKLAAVTERFEVQGRTVDELKGALERYSGKALEVAKADEIRNATRQVVRQHVKDIADAYASAANELGQFLNILGASTPQTDAFVQGIGQISGAIGKLAIGDTLGGLKSGLAGIASFAQLAFGNESASARAVREALAATRTKLTDHQRTLGDLIAISTPGRQLGGVEAVLGGINFGKFADNDLARDVNDKILKQLVGKALLDRGLSMADLDEVAAAFGQEIRDDKGRLNAKLLQRLLDLLASSETGFSDTFAGQLDRIRQGKDVGVVTDELGEVLALINDPKLGVPAIAAALKGAGTDPKARVAALQSLFKLLDTPGAITKGALGGATEAEFRAVIKQLIDLLLAATDDAAVPVTPDRPPVDPTADPGDASGGASSAGGADTAAPGGSMFGLVEDGFAAVNDYLAEIANDLASFRPVAPPVLPDALRAGGSITAAGLSVGDISINVSVTPNPNQSPTEIGEAAVDAIERALAVRFQQVRANLGSASR